MIKTCLAICVFLIAASTNVYEQSRSKRVKQPREVLEAYQVCGEFQRLLAQDLDFDRAYEATFTKDPVRRRAIAESELREIDLSKADDATLVKIYKRKAHLLVLMLPLLFAGGTDTDEELLPPPIKLMLERKPPNDAQMFPTYATQLDRDVADFRAHVEKLATENPAIAKNFREYKHYLQKRLTPPNRVVKPLTAYSKEKVLRVDEKYYQIDNCAVIREDGHMRIVGYLFIKFRW